MNFKKYIRFFLLSLMLSGSYFAFSQNYSPEQLHYYDSLWNGYQNKKNNDTLRMYFINELAWELQFSVPDSSIKLSQITLKLAESKGNLSYQAKAYSAMGAAYYLLNKFDVAIIYHNKSRAINVKRKDLRGIGANENNLSLVYFAQGDYLTAMDHVYKGLRNHEKIKNERGIVSANNNLAMILSAMNKPEEALKYYKRNIAFVEKSGNLQNLSLYYNNMGIAYFQLHDFAKALKSYSKALELARQNFEPQSELLALNELGGLYFELNKLEESEKYLQECIDLSKKAGDLEQLAHSNNNIGKLYLKQKKFTAGVDACQESLKLANELGMLEVARNNCECIYEGYKSMNKEDIALSYYEQTVKLNDSLQTINNRKEIARKELQYDYEKRTAANKLKHEKEQSVKEATIKLQDDSLNRERTLKYFLYAGLLLIAVILVILFKRYRISAKQKSIIESQKEIVEAQKHEVEEKNKDITDSINYAQRIQRSFLPKPDDLDEWLGEYFVLFQPKDIVSGDFYWGASVKTTSKTEKETRVIVFATGDCTGHGVPGAMMTMIGNTLLNQTLHHPDINTPADALDFLNNELPKNLKRQKGETSIRDGMDLVMIAIDKTAGKLYMAGANNSLYLIRDKKLVEYRGDSQAVTASDDSEKLNFTDHRIDISPGDVIYMTTDGYPDQFGGPKGKKFKFKQLEEMLVAGSDLPMEDQKIILEQKFATWKGELEQVDDVTVVGIRV